VCDYRRSSWRELALACFTETELTSFGLPLPSQLGNLMARTFAESGSNSIVILDLDEMQAQHAAEDLVKWFEEHGGAKKGEISAIGLGCDVGNEDAVKEVFGKIVDKYGRVDVLVTAAGIVGESSVNRGFAS
jgi:D-arabinitol 2-dehydrogenase